MKNFITWAVIAIAFVVSIIECFYGNPGRIILYTLILLFMGAGSWLMKKLKD